MLRCWTIRIAILLAIGAGLNVAVAWTLVLTVDPADARIASMSSRNTDARNLVLDVFAEDPAAVPAIKNLDWTASVPRQWPPPTEGRRMEMLGCTGRHRRAELNPDSTEEYRVLMASQETLSWHELVAEAGLPLRSLKTRYLFTLDATAAGFEAVQHRQSIWNHGVQIREDSSGPGDAQATHLPIQPLPVGFLTNSTLYGGFVGMCWLACRNGRRRLRGIRGLCPYCGYPKGVTPHCTECGKTP